MRLQTNPTIDGLPVIKVGTLKDYVIYEWVNACVSTKILYYCLGDQVKKSLTITTTEDGVVITNWEDFSENKRGE